ncbi:MAG: hypothetical protein RIQ56_417, partial [Candidatus Parcubacteria bacterium]
DFAGIVAASVSENSELRTALADVVQGKVPPPTHDMYSFSDFAAIKFDEAVLVKAWHDYALSHGFHVPGRAALTAVEQDKMRREFLEGKLLSERAKIQAKGGGTWAAAAERRYEDFLRLEDLDRLTPPKVPVVAPPPPARRPIRPLKRKGRR